MNKLLILLTLVLVGCADEECKNKVYHQNIAMYGDSLCAECGSTPDKLGIDKQCVPGKAMIKLEGFDAKHELIFLAMGINDVQQEVSSDDYRDHLGYLLQSTDSQIVCILPNAHPYLDSSEHRQAMIDSCADYIDPVLDCGVSIGHSDGVHYNQYDYGALSACIEPYIENFKD